MLLRRPLTRLKGALPALPAEPSTGDNTLIMALEALGASDYAHALTLVNEAIEQGISWDDGKAEALNLRGTFKFLMTDVDGAKADFLASLELQPALTQTWVKIASVHLEQGNLDEAFKAFDEAIKHNPNDSNIYYHRGQSKPDIRNLDSEVITDDAMDSLIHHGEVQGRGGKLPQVGRA